MRLNMKLTNCISEILYGNSQRRLFSYQLGGGAIYQISLKPKKNKIEINGGKYLGSYGTTVITLYKS